MTEDVVRLCLESHAPIDTDNCRGPIHCIQHPHGYPCATALYRQVYGTIDTAADRQVATTQLGYRRTVERRLLRLEDCAGIDDTSAPEPDAP